MHTATLSTKFQISVPKPVRDARSINWRVAGEKYQVRETTSRHHAQQFHARQVPAAAAAAGDPVTGLDTRLPMAGERVAECGCGVTGPALRPTAPDISALHMLRELAQALEVLASERPVVPWLEDLHWSDHASLEVLTFLAGRRDAGRLMLIASFRLGDAQDRDNPLLGLTQELSFRPAPELAVVELASFIHQCTEGHARAGASCSYKAVAGGCAGPSPSSLPACPTTCGN